MPEPLLSIRDLAVEFKTDDGIVHAVDGISYDVFPGEILGIVGESGSGKSVSTLALLGLIPQPPGRIASGTAMFKGIDLLRMKKSELRRFRGDEVAMVFQDPMTSLNPVLKIGFQLGEAIKTHYPKEPDDKVKSRVVDLLVRLDRLDDLLADPVHRVQRRHRVLEDHPDLGAPVLLHLLLGHCQKVGALVAHRPPEAGVDVARQPHDRHCGHALARARLADDAEHLAALELERHAVDGAHDTVFGDEVDVEVVDLQEALGHYVGLIRGSR